MARSMSTLKTMRTVSVVLFLAVAGLVYAGVDQMRHWNILTGWELVGWALIPFALLLSFTVPVRCKVKRTNGLACGHWAYGLLFGCRRTPDHWSEKFRLRLQFPQKEVKPVGRQPAGSLPLNYQPSQSSPQQLRLTVDDGRLGVCGFWVSVVSMVAAVIPVVAAVLH